MATTLPMALVPGIAQGSADRTCIVMHRGRDRQCPLLPLIGCCADPSSRWSHRRKAVAKRGFAAASSRAVTEMIKEVGENPAARPQGGAVREVPPHEVRRPEAVLP